MPKRKAGAITISTKYAKTEAGAKRLAAATKAVAAVAKASGYVRTAGNYGRFQGSGGPERKYLDSGFQGYVTASGGVVNWTAPATKTSMVEIAQGTGNNQRIGRKINVRTIHLQAVIYSEAAAAATAFGGEMVRVALVLDKQANGATPSSSLIYDNFFGGGVFGAACSFRNKENEARFRVLKEWRVPITPQFGVATAGTTGVIAYDTKRVEVYKKVNIPIEYNGTTGAITEIRSNNLLLLLSSSLTGHDTAINIMGGMRITYDDA
jgi:hypothetical protein